jgi:predicted transposase YdaD
VEEILQADLALLPMAPLTSVPLEQVPEVLQRVDDRLRQSATPAEAETLWTALFVLMGLRYPPEVTDNLARGVRLMIDVRESSFYQLAISEGERKGELEGQRKGRCAEAIRFLLAIGGKRFGPVPPAIRATIEGMTDLEHLERLTDRLLDASGWDDLLATP